MLLDFEAGRRLEIDFINGAIPRVGREAGVPAPVNATVTALVKALPRQIHRGVVEVPEPLRLAAR